MRIPALIKDPRPVLPILEALKDDADLYVRRTAAWPITLATSQRTIPLSHLNFANAG
jgi:3-methyladenine DNA glycosylase AlkC